MMIDYNYLQTSSPHFLPNKIAHFLLAKDWIFAQNESSKIAS